MTIDEVMRFRRATPFKPFVVTTTDGRRFVIREPEQIGRNPAMTKLGIALDDGETADVVDGSAVASVEVVNGDLPPRAGAGAT